MTDEDTQTVWSAEAWSVWAKSSTEDENLRLPLPQHLEDAAGVAGLIWDRLLADATKAQIEAGLPSAARDGRALVGWVAGLHDLGKASPGFVSAVPHLAEATRLLGGDLSVQALGDRRHAPHGAVGEWVLQAWLEERYGASTRSARTYAAVVGAHHGSAPSDQVILGLANLPHLTGNEVWQRVRSEILSTMTATTGAERYLPAWAGHPLPPAVQMLVTGVVIVADWISSSAYGFPYTGPGVPLAPTEHRVEAGWRAVGLPGPWRPKAPPGSANHHLRARFPFIKHGANAVQVAVVEAAREMEPPGMLIVEAPMGHGKTEAALLAAEVLAARSGAGGVFVGLPTMATSDAMFSRVRAWIDHLDDNAAFTLQLAHSKGELNEEFGSLPDRSPVSGVYDEGESPGRPEAVAAAWLKSRKRGALATFVVGTIDQALIAGLQAKHVMLRHLALSGKVVVIDEVHAADDFMRVYLCAVLTWLGRYGTPVVLLSATLPAAQREELVRAYAAGGGGHPQVTSSQAYPAITTVGPGRAEVVDVNLTQRPTEVELEGVGDDLIGLIDRIGRESASGGIVGIIHNTVARAQQTYEALAARHGEERVVLLHSRFLAPHRLHREAELRRRLGRDGHRPDRLFVVGTQVLEQSLDIDLDLLVTDLAPIDLVLQRIGRLHRHPGRDRPAAFAQARVLVTGYTEDADGGVPDLDPGGVAVYGAALLLRTAAALHLVGQLVGELSTRIALPTDIRALIERVYAEAPDVPEAWRTAVDAADMDRAARIAAARHRADNYRLNAPVRPADPLNDFLNPAHDDDAAGQRQVRDGDDGLEVLVVQRRDGALHLMADIGPMSGRQVTELEEPETDVARALASCTVRLPRRCVWPPHQLLATVDWLEERGLPNFQSSRWLAGQLVFVLNEELRGEVAGVHLQYDARIGLTVVTDA